jgi:hypothetical protein
MSEDLGSGGGGHIKMAIGGVVTIVVGVTVAFLHPIAEKKGQEVAGIKSEVVANGAPAVVVVQSPGGNAASPSANPAPVATGSASDRTVETSASLPASPTTSPATAASANVTTTVIVTPSQQAVSSRQPHNIKNDISIPHFDSTEQVEYFDSTGTGSSEDRETAIFKALEEALSKQGAQISADVRLKMLAETKRLNEFKTRKVEQSVSSDFSRATDGLLRWWDIRSEEDDGAKYTIEVACVVAKIKAQAMLHSTRKTLAVLPFKVDADASLIGRTVTADAIGKQFRESALTYLVNSRKFAVLDKTFTDELDRLAGEHPSTDPIQRAIDAAMKLGAQYAVVGVVNGFGVTQKHVGTLDVPIADGTVSLRIIELSSRQTVLASAFQVADMPDLDLSGAHPENSIADTLGRAMAARTLETIYPFKVAALNGPDEVILNRGGDDLSVGQQFDLCNPGEEIKDPSTGESLGVAERKVATVEVTRVTPKTSYAKVIAKTEDIMAGAICRKPQQPAAETKAKAAPAKNEIDNLFEAAPAKNEIDNLFK